jgi:hypothetical protein
VRDPQADSQADITRLANVIYRDKVLRARQQDPVQKLLEGFALFRAGLELTKLDVMRTIGTTDEDAVAEALQHRFSRVRQTRNAGLYKPLPTR